MWQFLDGLLHNKVLLCAIAGWFVAQVCKALLFALMNHRFQWERLVGSGGMPSSEVKRLRNVSTGMRLMAAISARLKASR